MKLAWRLGPVVLSAAAAWDHRTLASFWLAHSPRDRTQAAEEQEEGGGVGDLYTADTHGGCVLSPCHTVLHVCYSPDLSYREGK